MPVLPPCDSRQPLSLWFFFWLQLLLSIVALQPNASIASMVVLVAKLHRLLRDHGCLPIVLLSSSRVVTGFHMGPMIGMCAEVRCFDYGFVPLVCVVSLNTCSDFMWVFTLVIVQILTKKNFKRMSFQIGFQIFAETKMQTRKTDGAHMLGASRESLKLDVCVDDCHPQTHQPQPEFSLQWQVCCFSWR